MHCAKYSTHNKYLTAAWSDAVLVNGQILITNTIHHLCLAALI